MGAREIKTTIAIDGEKQFKSAISEAQRSLRVLQSELKAETSAFDESTSAQTRAETKAKSLRTQIEQQKKIVEALRGAVADSANKWGESSAQADGYRIKLANAQKTLNDMTHDLGEAQKASDGLNRSFGETMRAMGPELKNTLSAAGNVISTVGAAGAAAFGAVTAAAAGATKGVADMVADTSVQADDLLTLSLQTGIDVETLQAWRYAARFVDTEVSSITDSIKKLRVNMQSVEKKTGLNDALVKLGVQAKDGAGRYRDAVDVFWDVIDAAHTNVKNLNETELDTILQQTMGKGYTDLLPLISAGRQGWEEAMNRAYSSGFVMDQETVNAFGAYNDLLQQAEAAWVSIKNSMATIALDYATPIASDVGDIATAFNRLLRGEDGAGEDLAGSVETLFADAQTALITGWNGLNDTIAALEESDSQSAQQLGGALGSLRDGLKDIWQNRDSYVQALEAIFAAMVGVKAAQAGANLVTIASGLGKIVGPMKSAAPAALPVAGFAAAGAGIQAWADSMEESAQALREAGKVINAGKYADVPGGRDILQAYADKVHEQGWNAITWADFEPILDAFGESRGADILAELETYKLTGGERWIVPEDWFDISLAGQTMSEALQGILTESALSVDPAIAEGWADGAQAALQGELNGMRLSVDVQANLSGLGGTGRWVDSLVTGAADGSHAGGLDYVPFDNYRALLHRGERVLTAGEAAGTRTGGAGAAGGGGVTMRQALSLLRAALSGVTVQMERETVGHLVAGTVSADIALEIGEG